MATKIQIFYKEVGTDTYRSTIWILDETYLVIFKHYVEVIFFLKDQDK